MKVNKQSFPSFQEASSFARSKAQEFGRTVRMERDGSNFVVVFDHGSTYESSKTQTANLTRNTYNPDIWWKKHLEQKQIALEEKRIQGKAEERARRKPYLDERKKYFESLPDKKLDVLWATREESDMEKDEVLLLRSVVRETKGIKPISDVRANMNFCPRCSLPVDNCTCERSWW